ncbi:hypothetical protein K1719_029953 [Acacia pycnantha]|nr:hypothetical protein K1719_029953 [Acacia pycnantha]
MLVSSKHQKLKMINKKNKVVTVKGDQKQSRQCYYNTVRLEPSRLPRSNASKAPEEDSEGKSVSVVELDLREEEKMKTEPSGELEDFRLGSELGQVTKIGKELDPARRIELRQFLRANRDVFAWNPSEIPRIDPSFCCHRLAIKPGSALVSQKRRNSGKKGEMPWRRT